jgi:TrmH family RNA methyltransferase
LPRLRVVLVRPERSVNVGAVARAMRNTGLDELCLVEPGDWRTLECWRSARGAHELLEAARVFDGLADALAGAEYVAGLSRRRGGDAPRIDVRDLATEVASCRPTHTAALVFGPERTGLTGADLDLCGRRAWIPTHPDQPSLNLSHAVLVAGYEIHRARGRKPGAAKQVPHDRKLAFLPLVREALDSVGGLPPKSADSAFRGWQTMLLRADLTPTDLRRLEHLARRVLLAGRREGGS